MYEHVRTWKTPYFQDTLTGGCPCLRSPAWWGKQPGEPGSFSPWIGLFSNFLPPNPGAMVSKKPSSCWGFSRVTSWLWYCCFNSGQWHKVPLVNSSLIPMILTLLTMIIYKSTKKNEVEIILPGIAILTVAFCQDHESLETKGFPAYWADPESEFWGHLVGGDGRKRSWEKNVDGRNWLHWKLETVSNVVDHIMWVQIYVLGTFEMERKRQDLEILVWRSCPLKAPSSLFSDNAWQGPKLSFYFQKLKERIPAKLGNVHLLPCKYVSFIFQREREKTKNCI